MYIWDIPRYSASFAGRLIGLRPERVRRWLKGYEYIYTTAGSPEAHWVYKEPVIRRKEAAELSYASFLDLVDLLFVSRFLEYGFSLQRIRKALAEAESIIGSLHFAQRNFFTDGSEIYLQVKDKGAESLIQLLSGGQWVITDIIKQIATQIDFHKETGFAEKWYPYGREGRIVLDPRICFGAPTIVKHGVRSANIYDLFIAESHNIDNVVSWMDLNSLDVQAAVKFEKSLTG